MSVLVFVFFGGLFLFIAWHLWYQMELVDDLNDDPEDDFERRMRKKFARETPTTVNPSETSWDKGRVQVYDDGITWLYCYPDYYGGYSIMIMRNGDDGEYYSYCVQDKKYRDAFDPQRIDITEPLYVLSSQKRCPYIVNADMTWLHDGYVEDEIRIERITK